jgi:mannose-6-phosphate isomerase-like protein (cupin superfamily)
MNSFIDWRAHEAFRPDKFNKVTLWEGKHVMLGLNCFEPGQSQSVHAHDGADKFYFVLAGRARFRVGEDESEAGPGTVIVAPAGVPHGVTNMDQERLSLLIGIAPGIK